MAARAMTLIGLSFTNRSKIEPRIIGSASVHSQDCHESGGLPKPAQKITFKGLDPKPNVVAEHRSPYRPIATTIPGMQFTALLPRTARIAHKLAVVRSMHHPKPVANAHENG